ncbi:hypothetical protein BK004_03955 [bacterium CG10_46_32]|nr:MAG: hypothetical protein BK004_03955 [bacterium CG10_46_32]PIR55849.1 MAG: hypothetical protein COU73_03990 [Parcubacteria group bacterium CG10_big_fil_rev_8_21_14_0_10_46_32]
MSDRTKLILKIIGFIAIVLLLGWGIWALFFRSPGTSIVPGQVSAPSGQLPDIGAGTGGRVVDTTGDARNLAPEPAAEPVAPDLVASGGRTLVSSITPSRADFSAVSSNGSLNYYDARDERFYRVNPAGGAPMPLSDQVFRSVESVVWSNNGTTAVLEFPDGSNIFYDFNRNIQATLPPEAQEFSFSPDDSQLAYEYIGESEDDRWIITSSPDGQGEELVQALGKQSRNVKVDWSPNNQVIATFREPTSSAGEEVFFIGLNNENFLSLQTNGLGFEGAWSPTGKQMMYSVYSAGTNYNPVLYIAGAEGNNIGLGNRSLRVQTWPDKCVFASENIVYCAVPQFLSEGSGIFREQTYGTPDTIYKIDLINNSSFPIAFPETAGSSSFTIETVSISSDGKELYFVDRVSGRIHKLPL